MCAAFIATKPPVCCYIIGLPCWCIDPLHILDIVHLYLLSCYHNRMMAGFQGYMSITRIKSVIWNGAVMVYKKCSHKAHNALIHPLCTDNWVLKLSFIICDRISTLVCCFRGLFFMSEHAPMIVWHEPGSKVKYRKSTYWPKERVCNFYMYIEE